MKVVWIGAGRLASSLAPALRQAGHETLQVYSRTAESASRLAAVLDCPFTDDAEAVRTDADVYLFSVKDSVLEELARRICPRVGEALCLHTAGSMPMTVFSGQARRYGVLYPMQTFSLSHPVDFGGIPCFVEGCDAEVCGEVKRLARSVSQRVTVMDSARRRYLHLAAVFACNFANHCYALSARVLQSQGIPFDVMLPLIDETARKVHSLPPVEAQTGPAVRYDRNVLEAQRALLEGMPELQSLYDEMSRSIHRMALQEKKNEGVGYD